MTGLRNALMTGYKSTDLEGSKNYWLMYLGFDFGLLAC